MEEYKQPKKESENQPEIIASRPPVRPVRRAVRDVSGEVVKPVAPKPVETVKPVAAKPVETAATVVSESAQAAKPAKQRNPVESKPEPVIRPSTSQPGASQNVTPAKPAGQGAVRRPKLTVVTDTPTAMIDTDLASKKAPSNLTRDVFAPEAGGEDEKPVLGKAKKKKKEKVPLPPDRGGVISSVVKALVYISFVLVVSGFLAVYGIRLANDVFAFVKDEITVEVTIADDATLEEVSELLYENGLVENANWFRLYTSFKYRDKDLNFVGGTYTLQSTMNYNAFISTLTPKQGRAIVSILIPEGYTVDQIIDLLVSEGIGTREGYVEAIQEYDYNYEFLDKLEALELSNERKYRLEGYLFPAKYDFYADSSEIAVVDKMLAAFQENFMEENYDRLTELGLTLDEAVTLASIIQREAYYSTDMYYISAVFHNRLNSSSFPKLQSDATVQYALPEHKEELTAEDLKVDSPYNTHVVDGLPIGAICNPGTEAISAALYPEDKDQIKYYYFVAGVDGYSLFATNLTEHNNNMARVEQQKASGRT